MKTIQVSARYTKTYASYAKALDVAEKLLSQLSENDQSAIRVVVLATPEGNRFSPAFILDPKVHYLAIQFAGQGFVVIG